MIAKFFNIFCIVTLVVLVLMGLLDLVFFIFGGKGETLSYQFWVLSQQYPVIPFFFGVLAGHLVWQYNPNSENKDGTEDEFKDRRI